MMIIFQSFIIASLSFSGHSNFFFHFLLLLSNQMTLSRRRKLQRLWGNSLLLDKNGPKLQSNMRKRVYTQLSLSWWSILLRFTINYAGKALYEIKKLKVNVSIFVGNHFPENRFISMMISCWFITVMWYFSPVAIEIESVVWFKKVGSKQTIEKWSVTECSRGNSSIWKHCIIYLIT